MLQALERAWGTKRAIGKKSMQVRASRIFAMDQVQKFLAFLKDRNLIVVERQQLRQVPPPLAEDVTNKRLVEEEACLAFSNLQDLYDEDGRLIPITDLPAHIARAIKEFEGVILEGKDGEKIQYIKKIKLHDKGDALQRLERVQGMYTNPEISVNLNLKALLLQIDGSCKGKLPSEVG